MKFSAFKQGDRANIDFKLEEQKTVAKFLLLEGEKHCHIFQMLQKCFF